MSRPTTPRQVFLLEITDLNRWRWFQWQDFFALLCSTRLRRDTRSVGQCWQWENWYGIATNSHGTPYVQGADDPAEGAYVSTTSLQDVSKDIDDPDRYVDSAGVSYLVLPDNFSLGQPLGDIAFAWNILTGDSTNLVHADVGDRNHLKRDLG
jgi:hypothetical protein